MPIPMRYDSDVPPPLSLSKLILAIPVGQSVFLLAKKRSVQVTVSRLKATTGGEYTTRAEGLGVRVWRLQQGETNGASAEADQDPAAG
jgi:hypothetical protein